MLAKDLLSSEVKKWLQKSLESELYASRLYQHIANNLQRLGYFGGQKHYLSESADELKHYQILVDFYNDMGSVAPTPKVDAITDSVMSLSDAISLQYEAELDLLKQYEEFYDMVEEKDCITAQFLLQFIEIQRKSVGDAGDLLAVCKIATDNKELLFFDKQLGKK